MILVNGEEIEFSCFPNGEFKVKDFAVENINRIVFKYESNSDLIILMFVKEHIDSVKFAENKLLIPYFPYSRMDRKIEGDVFTLKGICNFINRLNFDEVVTYDAHSDVCLNLIKNVTNINKSTKLFYYLKNKLRYDIDYVLYPDQGAVDRYHIPNQKFIVGNKVRDEQTGRILSYEIEGEIEKDSNICIIDDLSSYGGTFIKASKILKEMGAKSVILIVTHCEDSILRGDLFKNDDIDFVLTTNSIIESVNETNRLVILDILN